LALFESRLKHWVSIRQTGQHPTNEAGAEEPIAFHQPVNNVLEWSTSIESGICMANLCEDWVPEDFWRKAYNLSSGAGYRLASWELYDIQLGAFGIGIKIYLMLRCLLCTTSMVITILMVTYLMTCFISAVSRQNNTGVE